MDNFFSRNISCVLNLHKAFECLWLRGLVHKSMEVSKKNGVYTVDESTDIDRVSAVHDQDRLLCNCSNCLDQLRLVFWHANIFQIKALGLILIIPTGVYNSRFCVSRYLNSLCDRGIFRTIFFEAQGGCIWSRLANLKLLRSSHAQLDIFLLQDIQGGVFVLRNRRCAATSGNHWVNSILAYDGYAGSLFWFYRQGIVIILEKNHSTRCNFSSEFVCLLVHLRSFICELKSSSGSIAKFQSSQGQNVNLTLCDQPRIHCFEKLVSSKNRKGHLDVKSSLDWLSCRMSAEPIRHGKAFEVPFISQNSLRQGWVFTTKLAVNLVISAPCQPQVNFDGN
ncbi:hypothetical protein HG530_011654 [Fusarium avenaceum]|nr:hypothetical protein HG530_011654 [Fusarium avenaceum]